MIIQTVAKQRVMRSPSYQNPAQGNLIIDLCDALEKYGVRYCHWKSNANLEKALNGEGDLDLLIHKQDVQTFNQIVMGLGFKEAEVPDNKRIPGIRDYYGYDSQVQDLIHVHAHFQLTVGHDATKRIHLNIEDEYLSSTRKSGPIRIPSAEFEYILLVIRMVFKYLTWSAFFSGAWRISKSERFEYDWLKKQISFEKIHEIILSCFPTIILSDFHRCTGVIEGGLIGLRQIRIGQRVANQLRNLSRLSGWETWWREFGYRFKKGFRHRILKSTDGKKLTSRGIFIAIVGGDGAGKTTLISSLLPWINKDFETMQVHLGKPDWSVRTVLVRSFLKIFRLAGSRPFLEAPLVYTDDSQKIRFPGYPWAIREVCTARDRFLTYRKARKFATNGGIVISDRYPLPGIHFMDGPQIERMYNNPVKNWTIRWLIEREKKFYLNIRRPDLLIVLKVDPAIAAGRKTDEEREGVLARSGEIWTHDWSQPDTHLIDASLPCEEVLEKVKALIWSYL